MNAKSAIDISEQNVADDLAEAIALFDDIDELGDDKKAEITTEG